MPRGPQKRSEATRAVLQETARRLFTEHGYASVTADDLVAEAGLTRGALHHQFGDKQGLFREVFRRIEHEINEEISAALETADAPEAKMLIAIETFLGACTRPEVVRIALLDAPAVLGWSEWRAIEAEHGLQVITGLLEEGMATGLIPRQSVDALAPMILSSVIEAALLIAHAEEPETMREQARQALGSLLGGLVSGV